MNRVITLCILVLNGCNESKTSFDHQNNLQTNNLEFITKGVVRGFTEKGMVLIEHEEIPNYMKSMTMPFNLKNKAEIKEVKIGDEISFKFNVREKGSWIDEIKIVEINKHQNIENGKHVSFDVNEKKYLTIGDKIENYNFINHKNKSININHFNEKVLVITFMYTRCPVPDFCPQLSLKFKTALDRLGSETANQNRYHFLSITFDPEIDTPSILNNYAKLYGASDHENWSFLTSSTEIINNLTDKVGIVISRDKKSVLSWDHNLRTLVVDESGKIKSILVGNLWSADDLVDEIKELLEVHR